MLYNSVSQWICSYLSEQILRSSNLSEFNLDIFTFIPSTFFILCTSGTEKKTEASCVFVSLPSSLLHVAFTKHLCLIHCSASSDFIDFHTWTFLSSQAEESTTAAILGAIV